MKEHYIQASGYPTGKTYKSLKECAVDIGGTRQGINYAIHNQKLYKGHKLIKCEA